MKEIEIKVPETFDEIPVVVSDQGVYYSLRKLEANYKKYTEWHETDKELPTPFESCVVLYMADVEIGFYNDEKGVWIDANEFEPFRHQEYVHSWQYLNIPTS